ncbi:MAG: hypothetical protein ABL958_16365, partial [Bdellovibrionia bacterium]
LVAHELRAIDAVARTLMGEGAGCQFNLKKDEYRPGHFEALGRSIADRGRCIEDGTLNCDQGFSRRNSMPSNASEMSAMEQVVSRDNQYNCWDNISIGRTKKGKRIVKHNGPLITAMCPKNNKNERFHVTAPATLSPEDEELWRWAVEIASQMVIGQRSGLSEFQKAYPVMINGRPNYNQLMSFYTHGSSKQDFGDDKEPVEVPNITGVGNRVLNYDSRQCRRMHIWNPVLREDLPRNHPRYRPKPPPKRARKR